MIAHLSPISGVACYRDRWVATAGYDNQVIMWEASSRRPVARAMHDHLANQCSFSPDGQHLVTASSDYTARLWSVPDLSLRAVLTEHQDDVEMAVFHPSEKLIATASRDFVVRVFGFDGRLVAAFPGHEADVISVEWAEKPDELVSSSDDGTIRRWSLTTRGPIAQIDMDGVETDTVALDVDGTVYAGNDAGEIVVIREAVRTAVPAHDAGIKRLVISPEHGLLVSLSYDRTARIWSTAGDALSLRSSSALPSDVWPRSCAVKGSGELVFATFGSTYRTFDPTTGIWDDVEVPPTWGANAVTVPDDVDEGGTAGAGGRHAVLVGDAGQVWRQHLDTGVRRPLSNIGSLCNFLTPADAIIFTGGQLGLVADALTGQGLHQHRSPLNCAAVFIRDDDQHVVVGTYTGEGLLFQRDFNAAAGWRFVRELHLLDNAVKGVACGRTQLFAVCADRSVVWFDLATLTPLRRVAKAHERIVNGCSCLGGDRFASVGRDLTLRLWAEDGTAQVLTTPHDHSIKCVAADRRTDGLVATGSYNGRLAIYHLGAGRWVYDERPTTSGVSSLAYDRISDRFLASSYDGNMYQVDAAAVR